RSGTGSPRKKLRKSKERNGRIYELRPRNPYKLTSLRVSMDMTRCIDLLSQPLPREARRRLPELKCFHHMAPTHNCWSADDGRSPPGNRLSGSGCESTSRGLHDRMGRAAKG